MKRQGIVILIIINALIHLYLFNRSPLQFDELLTFNLIRDLDFSELVKFLTFQEVQMPLNYLVIKLMSYLSLDAYWLRLPTLILTLILPYIIYLNARFTLNHLDALKAALLISLSYPVLFYSHSLRPYILLLTSFSYSCYLLRLRITNNERKRHWRYPLSLVILFLSHPIGAVGAFAMSGISLLKNKKKSDGIIFTLLLLAAIAGLLVFLRNDITEKFILNQDVFHLLINYVYRLSFLSSGALFSALLLMLIIITLYQKKYRLDFFNLQWLITPILLSLLCLPFFGSFLHARHLIFITPPLIFLALEMANLVARPSLQKYIFSLALLSLLIKGFYLERIQDVAMELESEQMSAKLLELSQGKIPIINCGNCLSYYIKSDQLNCIGKNYDHTKLTYITGQFLYLNLDFVRNSCGLQHFDRRILKLESYSFKGGTVYLMDRSPLHDNLHPGLPSKDHITIDP